jgi:TIR domain-containing protein
MAEAAASAQKVFICYRRQETSPYAGRIYDAMVARFGEENVFMDLELPPGVDFVERITRVVSGCVALIVVIGPSWAELQTEDGTRRIQDPDDFVRLEVETGLRRHDVTPIPVLVGGARMPRREDLPAEIQAITRRNALELSEGRWTYDVGRLLQTLEQLLPGAARQRPGGSEPLPPPRPELPELGWRLALEGALLAGVTAVAGRLLVAPLLSNLHEKPEVKQALRAGETVEDHEGVGEVLEHMAPLVVRRTATLALVGAVLAVWLARKVWRIYPLRHLLRGLLVGALAGLLGGAIYGAAVYAPGESLTLEGRNAVDLAGSAVSGGILGSLIGWFWRPRRVGPAVFTGAFGGFLFQLIVYLGRWENRGLESSALRFGLGTALVVGLTLSALLLGDRTEAAERHPAAQTE